jgi:hypothetical protein
MSKRSTDLFEEMQSIFGASFSPTVTSLNESLDEGAKHARGGDMRPMPSKRGGRDAVSKRTRKQQFHKPGKAKRDRDLTGLKKIKRTAAKTATKDDDSALKAFFKDPEVRGDKSKAKSKSKSKEKSGGGGGASGETSSRKSSSGHDPFKNSSNLGKGPGTPKGHTGTGPRKHNATGCWDCTCPGNVYSSGCNCKSTGKGANCPPKNTLKHIKYKSKYKRAYNDLYHAWRGDKDKRASK